MMADEADEMNQPAIQSALDSTERRPNAGRPSGSSGGGGRDSQRPLND